MEKSEVIKKFVLEAAELTKKILSDDEIQKLKEPYFELAREVIFKDILIEKLKDL